MIGQVDGDSLAKLLQLVDSWSVVVGATSVVASTNTVSANLVTNLVHLGDIPHALASILFMLNSCVIAKLRDRPSHDLLLVSR